MNLETEIEKHIDLAERMGVKSITLTLLIEALATIKALKAPA